MKHSCLTSLALVACTGSSQPADPDARASAPDGRSPDGPTPDAYVPLPADTVVHTLDVSLLYPLPDLVDVVGRWLSASTEGAYGPLLPAGFLSGPGAGFDGEENGTDMLVLGVRLDPCAVRRDCLPELRLVFQPVGFLPLNHPDAGARGAFDAAFHAHYDLTVEEFTSLAHQLVALRLEHIGAYASDAVLGVHPGLVDMGGAFATELRTLLLRYLGASRLARITEFTLDTDCDSDTWRFKTRNANDSFFAPAPIALVQSTQQTSCGETFFTSIFVQLMTAGGLVEQLMPILGTDRPNIVSPAVVEAAQLATRLQRPDAHHAEDTDCLGCHYAESARMLAESEWNLAPVDPFSHARLVGYRRDNHLVNNLHAFGYLGRNISVMARVANESALVAETVQALLLPYL